MAGVGFVSIHYYREYLHRSVAAASALAHKASAQQLIVVINNQELTPALPPLIRKADVPHVDVAHHDNSGMEFGAYQIGLERLLSTDIDWFIFANDTFSTHGCFSAVYRDHLLSAIKEPSSTASPRAVGRIESTAMSFSIGGKRTHRWLTTNIFCLNRRALEILGNRLYFPELENLIRPSSDNKEFFAPQLDHAIREHIHDWLFRPESPYAWYAAEHLNDENAPKFANKARSILQEKYISATLEEAGASLIDINASNLHEKAQKRVEEALFKLRADRIRNDLHRSQY